MSGLLIRRALLVPVTPPPAVAATRASRPGRTGDHGLVDVLVRDDRVVSVTPTGSTGISSSTEYFDAQGRPLIPGLWDKHVHMTQWARTAGRLDVSGTAGPADLIQRVGAHIASLPSERSDSVIIGWGHRSAGWDEAATVASLDEVSGAHPVILVSGDGHSGWLNSAALRLLGAGEHITALDENEWFPVFSRMSELTTGESLDDLYRLAITDAYLRWRRRSRRARPPGRAAPSPPGPRQIRIAG